MKIGIDARFLTHPQPGGFKTYTENLIAALAEVDANNTYVLYVDRPPQPGAHIPDRPNFTLQVVSGSAPLVGMFWREQVALARRAARDRIDVLHSPCLTAPLQLSCPSVVTIHDMIWREPRKFSQRTQPSAKRAMIEWYYRFVPERAAHKASAIITVSNDAKNRIVKQLSVAPERIAVTYEAAKSIYRRIDDASPLESVRRKYDLSSGYILAVGSADPRKNLATLARAYALLTDELKSQHPLAIVWTHRFLAREMAEYVQALGIADRVRFLENVSDADLVLLYNAAALFVFPSLYEGFGLPPLEAMACGTPIAAADNSSIPEIVGEAARLFPAADERAMAQTIARILGDTKLRSDLIATGLERAAEFSWLRCARETMAVYEQAVSRRR
jgi:glycosyltransferase involved in cell wall biosynthesis